MLFGFGFGFGVMEWGLTLVVVGGEGRCYWSCAKDACSKKLDWTGE